ncbi:ABC transporter ATP-binding protein [Motiliproteus sp. MSK22-1]|uniref:ABC transporter ATP-binding protein n=1 Tax=Motiliproteus sp. MSK22-1 TaxID=1897630 RepID=UPI00097692EE|nr:ABC transporter ATP-binding protein [Motiliproteus sp. MSK22-1]OMH38280.1 ABC transporter ATP-binding protein [Motiliproteus sp. MSK22-1]
MSNTVLEVKNVLKTFGGLKALNDLNLTVKEGTVHAIIGPNGAGKSTMLNVCIGQLTPDTGSVTFNGEMITGKKPFEINQAGISRVFQTPAIFEDLTILQNVMVPALASRDGDFTFNAFKSLQKENDLEEEAMKFLQEVSLEDQAHNLAGSMSRGNKRRLELAMCLIQHPKLLLLDEPTAGMARHDTNRTIDTLKKIKEGGMTKIIIEHDMHVVFSIADRISVLAQGTIIAEGTPDEIRGNPKVQEAYLGGAHL